MYIFDHGYNLNMKKIPNNVSYYVLFKVGEKMLQIGTFKMLNKVYGASFISHVPMILYFDGIVIVYRYIYRLFYLFS